MHIAQGIRTFTGEIGTTNYKHKQLQIFHFHNEPRVFSTYKGWTRKKMKKFIKEDIMRAEGGKSTYLR